MLDYPDERMSVPRLTGSPTRSSIAAPSTRVRALDAYDEFVAVLDGRAKRRELSDLGVEEATESPLFARSPSSARNLRRVCWRCCSTTPSSVAGCAST
jgi:hypothetical protein